MQLSWRREDLGYAAATAAAAAVLVYLVFGNFGLVPSPIAPATAADAPVFVGINTAAGDAPAVTVAPAPQPSAQPVPVAPPAAAADTAAPQVAITTQPGTTVTVAESATVAGTARDAGAGIDEVVVTFTNGQGGTQTVAATIGCDDPARRSCTFSADVPNVLGTYDAVATGSDRAGNTSRSDAVEISVVNVGGPVETITDTVEAVPPLLEQLVATVGGLLGLN